MNDKKIFTGKTVEEAILIGLSELGIEKEQAEIVVLEEGKKKLIGSVKAKVEISKKLTDEERCVEFIEGLLDILGIEAVAKVNADGEKTEIILTSMESNRLIGHHGETLDAIQTLAGAVANIGRDDYKKVIVDCENYRESRENTLIALAEKLAKKAVEKRRRVSLEPMNPYERRIIHSALSNNEEVKTVSDGKEPYRYVVIIPNNERTYEKRDRGDRRFNKDNRSRDNHRRDNRGRGGRDNRSEGVKTAKKEIRFGTFLGNSGKSGNEE
ncbi:MAG: RNA-binding cell elongation regulator Jag/EloR [Candidatus Coproplasma sp.]